LALGPSPAAVAVAFRQALSAAEAFAGATAPNPPVGCAILDEAGAVLACEAHRRAGGPHAEAAALAACRRAGLTDRIHTVVVTLEPCNHHGRTPPCAEAILATPAKAVWIGARDPNPRVAGGGAAHLTAHGVAVALAEDLPGAEGQDIAKSAARLIAPFRAWSLEGRPFVTVKQALDAEGSMIPPPGRKTFTSEASLTLAHALRRRADAILTGSGCILADDPAFTVRRLADHEGKRRKLVILDRRRRTPVRYVEAAQARGFEVMIRDDLDAALGELASLGALEVLVEAGATLTEEILRRGLWDEQVVIRKDADPSAPDQVTVRTRAWGEA
jgi:diaminohydroxyphosphoribosylaminopyrimidine deaminase/5-amino-6-(5-phosphoribosylamino)uracil reductase